MLMLVYSRCELAYKFEQDFIHDLRRYLFMFFDISVNTAIMIS